MLHLLLASCVLLCAEGITKEVYSSNAICRKNMCTNPLVPGMMDLSRLESITWQCATHSTVTEYMDFCKEAVIYDSALPSPNQTSAAVNLLVKAQDDAAATMFFFHLNGLGYEAWENQKPWTSKDPCVRSVWQMVCYTYFPKMDAGCQSNQATPYRRPCASTCNNYLSSCNVECCDESPQCVFSHEVPVADGQSVLQTGYVDAKAPSALCTGVTSAASGLRAPVALLLGLFGLQVFFAVAEPVSLGVSRPSKHQLLLALVLFVAMTLQGCDVDVPRHSVGNWRMQTDYLVAYEYIAPGQPSSSAILNSCGQATLAETLQCSGQGYCKAWNSEAPSPTSLAFCVCDRDFADPECRTKRKSQTTVFLCSLFGGFLGLDYFYLGFPLWGIAKLLTLGGCGFWWLTDIVRTGSGPVYSGDYRVAADLPHWVYSLSTITIFMIIGFLVGIESYIKYRARKRAEVLKMQRGEEERRLDTIGQDAGMYLQGEVANFKGPRGFTGYGATLPVQVPSGDAARNWGNGY